MQGEDVINRYDYVFSENGLVWFKNGKEGGCYCLLFQTIFNIIVLPPIHVVFHQKTNKIW